MDLAGAGGAASWECVNRAADCALNDSPGCLDQMVAWEEGSYKNTTVLSRPRLPKLTTSSYGSELVVQMSGIECQNWADDYPHLHDCNANSAFTGIGQTAASVGSDHPHFLSPDHTSTAVSRKQVPQPPQL